MLAPSLSLWLMGLIWGLSYGWDQDGEAAMSCQWLEGGWLVGGISSGGEVIRGGGPGCISSLSAPFYYRQVSQGLAAYFQPLPSYSQGH